MSMAGDTDFNLTDEPEDDIAGDGGDEVIAGLTDDDGAGDDRGDNLDTVAPDAADDDTPAAKTPKMVPYSRLAEMAAEKAQLLGIIEKMGGATAAAPAKAKEEAPVVEDPPFPLKEKLKERSRLQLEGDDDAVAAIDMEIEADREKRFSKRIKDAEDAAVKRTTEAMTVAATEREISVAVAEFRTEYPFLDVTKPKTLNKEAFDEVLMYANHYENKGHPSATAIRMAAAKVGKPIKEAEAKPTGAAKPTPATTLKPAALKQEQLRAAVRANNRQAPPIAKAGTSGKPNRDLDELNPDEMSDEELAQLTDAEKRALRGDNG